MRSIDPPSSATAIAPIIVRLLFAIFAITLTGCGQRVHNVEIEAMTTLVRITVHARRSPEWEALAQFIHERSQLYDHRNGQGPIGSLNRTGRARVDANTAALLATAIGVATGSAGAFDPTILPVTEAWDFDHGGRLPTTAELEAARELVDYRALRVDGRDVQLSGTPETGLDLGGIAKGAVVDEIGAWLESRGIRSYLIEAGGDILVFGLKPGNQPWRIAITHPRGGSLPLGIVALGAPLEHRSVVTSGDYERDVVIDGRTYHHILDPRTGLPVQGVAAVSVIAGTATLADAIATAAFVQGDLAIASRFPDVELLIVEDTPQGLTAIATSGFPVDVTSLNLE